MRPERLVLSGFAAYTQEQEVDFTGVDLFALAGPTGAGKSTIIDAIGFALYGAVPRFNDLRLVGAAVAAGQLELKVRLDFTIGGVAHTATRVVRKDGKGRASTKEARLERGDVVLATDADSLTQEVTRLLGLGFGDFCRCVVLPQGAFASFLHDKASSRQELLVGLLGAHLYGAVRERAAAEAKVAKARSDALEQRLAGDLSGATVAAVEAAAARVVELRAAEADVAAKQPRLRALELEIATAETAAREAADRVARLRAIRPPVGVAELAAEVAAARGAAAEADAGEARAADDAVKAEEALALAGDSAAVDAALAAHDAVAVVEADQARRAAAATAAEQEAATLRTAARAAAAARDEARLRFDELRQARAAHVLVPTLVVGEPCPVCRQDVVEVPAVAEPEGWGPARDAAEQADAAAAAAESAAAKAEGRAGAAAGEAEEASARLHAARAAAAAAGPRTALEAQRMRIQAAHQAVRDAQGADRAARAKARAARERVQAAAKAEERARTELDVARDTLAPLGPPALARSDLAADWSHLVGWAAAQLPVQERAAEEAASGASSVRQRIADLEQALRARLVEAGVDAHGRAPGEAVAAAVAEAVVRHDDLVAKVAEADQVRADTADAAERASVASTLATHLKADRFEKWLLDEAFGELLAGASTLLHDLSSGAYSLELDARREFSVVDHRNADERRSVKTLSGGETFLASLALALSLADKVVALSPGQVRLESLFLDEGFGTLDPATLDTVAGAIEHLGSSGRLVGIVTHVRELAERLPVRFDVQRGPKGATVERVLQ